MVEVKWSFKHVVGKSTFREGFAIPKAAECWIGAPEKGKKRLIWLTFEDQQIPATLRRLDNQAGHVQVKYENKAGEPFRNWLVSKFGTRPSEASGEFFELTKDGEDRFIVKAFPLHYSLFPTLRIEEWLFHKNANRMFDRLPALNEIPAVARTVEYVADAGQSHYNRAISASFKDWQ